LLTIVCLFFLFLLHILFCVPFQPKTVILTFYTFLLEHTTIKSKNNHMFTWNYYSVSTVEWYVYMQTVLIQWSKKWSPRGNQTLSSHKRKRKKRQTIVNKTENKKLSNTNQQKDGVNSGDTWVKAVPAQLVTPVVFLVVSHIRWYIIKEERMKGLWLQQTKHISVNLWQMWLQQTKHISVNLWQMWLQQTKHISVNLWQMW
jgi:hypothetical protein